HIILPQNYDINLFIYGLDEEAAKKKMEEIYENVCKAIPWEIILRLYNSPSEVLTGFDVDFYSVGTYRYDVRSLMTDSIYLGYVDMINLLIEYAVGGNTFSTFDVKEPEEETPIKVK
ncbi:13693_t:CDS:2, partial [Rhizophagus irregularis]